MKCPACGGDNDVSHKFCAHCGSRLTVVCPSCGTSTDPSHRFCPECGTSLHEDEPPAAATSPPPITEERRMVTALFADLVGFTSHSEARDPEEVRALLTRYFDISRMIVERFGGVVDKYIGDAVTAFWGARTAQADDAERAVRAALELVAAVTELGQEIGIEGLALRAGVLTGETAVGPGGNTQGLVVGDVVNTASRLQSVAEPGTVLVGEATFRLTNDAIDYQPLGAQDLRGKQISQQVWRALRVASARGGRGRAEGLEPPFVGRDPELRILKDLLHATGEERRARLISIVGEAGIGKSRLVWEFQKYVDGLVESVYWHQGRSPAYGEGVTFWALAEMIRRRARIAESDSDAHARLRLRTTVAEYVSDAEEQRWIEPRLAGLLGLEEMPAGDRTELYAALRTFFQRISERGTTVLVFEDLQWADPGLIAFIEELIDRSHRHPILVVSLARPELVNRAEGWLAARRNLTSLHLGPLSDPAMRGLVEGTLLGVGSELVDRIVSRAAGVPLYAVEMMRSLLADGTVERTEEGTYRLTHTLDRIAVPDSLHSVIGARLDRLPERQRQLLKSAAVLGQSFAVEALAAIVGESPIELPSALQPLIEAEILQIEDDPRSPERGQYRFVQSLIREVAYGRLTMAERRRAHLTVAEYLERLEDPGLAAAVASHFVDALEVDSTAADAEALAARAMETLARAARRAADLHSHRQVLTLASRALDIASDAGQRGDLLLLCAEAARGLVKIDEAVTYAEQAAGAFEEAGDTDGRLRAMTIAGRALADDNRPFDSIELMLPVQRQHEPPSTRAEVALSAALARSYMMGSRADDALAVADPALGQAESLEDVELVIDLLNTKGAALGDTGRPKEALALMRGALALAEEHDLTIAALRAHNNIGVYLVLEGSRQAAANLAAAYEKARALGDPFWLYRLSFGHANNLVQEGLFAEAKEVLSELDREAMPEQIGVTFDRILGTIEVITGDVSRGREQLLESLAHWDDIQEPQLKAIWGGTHAYLRFLVGEFEEAFDWAMGVEHQYGYPGELELATVAAVWLNDRERLATVTQRLSEAKERGRMIASLRRLQAIADQAMSGDSADASNQMRELLTELERTLQALGIAIVKAGVAKLLGLDDPVGRAAGSEARDWLESVGAVNLLEVFAPALPSTERARAASG